jgi:EpsI family protein
MLKQAPVLASLALVAVLAGYMLAFPPQRVAGTLLSSCPMQLGGMPGEKLELGQAVLDDLDPDDYLLRRYDRPDGVPAWLVIVYFQNARLGAHDPQLCYRSQGFQVVDASEGTIATPAGPIPYRGFTAVKGSRREVVRCFWYTAGGFLQDVKGWRDRMFFQGLRNNRSFGAFVRVSTLDTGDPAAAERSLQEITRDLAPRMPGFFPGAGAGREASR